MDSKIFHQKVTTRAGHTLSFFYNPENDLVVVDLVHKNKRGGNEILRKTLNEKSLVGFLQESSTDRLITPSKQEFKSYGIETDYCSCT
jgi:hypothetical protein